MRYKQSFIDLIDTCIQDKQYAGLGNPNAKILFVGKESAFKDMRRFIREHLKKQELY